MEKKGSRCTPGQAVALEEFEQLLVGAQGEGGGDGGDEQGVGGAEDVLGDQGDAGGAVQEQEVVALPGEGAQQFEELQGRLAVGVPQTRSMLR
jgi:hypothetical protein